MVLLKKTWRISYWVWAGVTDSGKSSVCML